MRNTGENLCFSVWKNIMILKKMQNKEKNAMTVREREKK